MKTIKLGRKFRSLEDDALQTIMIGYSDQHSDLDPDEKSNENYIVFPYEPHSAILDKLGEVIEINERDFGFEEVEVRRRVVSILFHMDYFEQKFKLLKETLHIDYNYFPSNRKKILASRLLSDELSQIKDHKGSYYKLIDSLLLQLADPEYFYDLANCYNDVGNREKAREYFTKATEVKRTRSDAFFALGCMSILDDTPYIDALTSAINSYKVEAPYPRKEFINANSRLASILCDTPNTPFKIVNSLLIKGIKKNGQTRILFEGGNFSIAELDLMVPEISNLFRTMKYQYKSLVQGDVGFFEIEVCLTDEYPYSFLNKVTTSGYGFEELFNVVKRFVTSEFPQL